MNSLLGYGSDDDCDDSSDEKPVDWQKRDEDTTKRQTTQRSSDTNYDNVRMDLSDEESEHRRRNRTKSPDRRRTSRERESTNKYESSRRRHHDRRRPSRRSDSRERRRRSRTRSRSRDRKRTRRSEERNKTMTVTESGGSSTSNAAPTNGAANCNSTANTNDRFFVPGITGRFRDQIERRKLLWQKKTVAPTVNTTTITNTNATGGQDKSKRVWESTTFAQDHDGKVASKFKRLMGIRNEEANPTPSSGGSGGGGVGGGSRDVLKKQEEMFSSMEQQYEVARTATHTMRGVGLGFGSYQR